MGADARDVIFTSSATEANNLALRSAFAEESPSAQIAEKKPSVLITSRLEHPSIARVAEALEREGRARVRWLEVTRDGVVSLADLERALAEESDVRLVATQAVNHEHGAIQPIAEIVARAHAQKIPVHVDAVQAVGRLHSTSFGADTVSIASHKIRGPKGVGALVMRVGYKLFPLLVGGAQERGLRPGTVDAALCAGFGVAAKIAADAPAAYARVAPLRDALEAALESLGLAVVGKHTARAPHVTCVVANEKWVGAELVSALDLEGVSASSGSACSAGTIEPSPVLAATLGDAVAARGLRLSLGPETTQSDVAFAVDAITRVLARV